MKHLLAKRKRVCQAWIAICIAAWYHEKNEGDRIWNVINTAKMKTPLLLYADSWKK